MALMAIYVIREMGGNRGFEFKKIVVSCMKAGQP
jgi:hypothetical protein